MKGHRQTSPGNAHLPSRVCPPHLQPCFPYGYGALKKDAFSPSVGASYAVPVRQASACSFLFGFHLTMDTLAVRLAVPPHRARRRLSLPSKRAVPGARQRRGGAEPTPPFFPRPTLEHIPQSRLRQALCLFQHSHRSRFADAHSVECWFTTVRDLRGKRRPDAHYGQHPPCPEALAPILSSPQVTSGGTNGSPIRPEDPKRAPAFRGSISLRLPGTWPSLIIRSNTRAPGWTLRTTPEKPPHPIRDSY